MIDPAKTAADQLVRLTRLIIQYQDTHPPLRGPAVPIRVLRHNGAELTAPEQQVFGLLIRGLHNDLLADLLQLPRRAVDDHLNAVLTDFGVPVPESPPPPARRDPARAFPRRRKVTILLIPITGTLVLCATPQIVSRLMNDKVAVDVPKGPPPLGPTNPLALYGVADHQPQGGLRFHYRATTEPLRISVLPNGIATATSFWDPATARGKPMKYRTMASPYWPLGTRVRVVYRGKSAIGVIDDFGPADWAVAQHTIPAIIDISEAMMADLTGKRANAVPVRFEVLQWGEGAIYRDSGPGYKLATGG